MRPRHVILILFIFIALVVPAAAEEKRFSIPVGSSPQKGPQDAPVTIIEFIDFQ